MKNTAKTGHLLILTVCILVLFVMAACPGDGGPGGTAHTHTWRGNLCTSCGVTGPVTSSQANLSIDGLSNLSLISNQSGEGWTWTANTATLTLSSGYGSANINFSNVKNDTINLVYSGDVNVNASGYDSAISYDGNLKISGSGGTLTLTSTGQSAIIKSDNKNLEINGGTIVAEGYSRGINTNGNVFISNADVTATATAAASGYESIGIYALAKEVTITNSTVSATGNGSLGYGIKADNGLTIKGSSEVSATGDYIGIYAGGKCITVSGGTVTALGSGDCAITPAYKVPKGYRYWTNTAASDPGGGGTVSNGSFETNTLYKWVKVEAPKK